LTGRLSRAHKRAELFKEVAERLAGREDAEALDLLALTDRTLAPGDPWADFYQGRALMIRKQFDKAADLLEPALAKVTGDAAGRFRIYYVSARLSAGQAVQAYRGLSKIRSAGTVAGTGAGAGERGDPSDSENPSDAFRTVASQLSWGGGIKDKKQQASALRQVIAARRADAPNDPWLDYYTAKADQAEDKTADADAAYTHGLSLSLPKDVAEIYRSARTYERFEAGKGLSAYEDDSRRPDLRDATFLQLARLYSGAKRTDELEKLVSMYPSDNPRSPMAALWQAEVLYERGSYEPALRLLTSRRRAILSQKDQTDPFFDRLIRCLVRLRRLDQAMAEAQSAARTLDALRREEAKEAAKEAGDADPTATPSPLSPVGTVDPYREPRPNPLYVLMIRAAEGDVPGATAAFEACLADDNEAADLYADPEIGPLLKADEFAPLRVKYPPEPAEPAATQPAEKD
jgi:hypothetical protein